MPVHPSLPVPPRVVLVHDWLTGMRGGEKCLEVLARRWPQAQLFTLLHRKGSVSPAIERLQPRTSLLDQLPLAHRFYRYLLPLMPAAMAGLRLPEADLVVSFSHCVAKSVRPTAPHVCYCFTPMRYAWQMRNAYFGGRLGGLPARLLDRILDRLRDWDLQTAARVDHFIAISRFIQSRIRTCYHRDSVVIYPPVDTEFYTPAPVPREDFYLVVSAFAPYKRLDHALQACARLGRPLVVIGSGQDGARLRSVAGPEAQFLGWQPDEVIRDHLRRCKALLFPAEEDFGIVPVEAMGCGAPVIALDRGGATETVIPLGRSASPTGVLYPEQSVEGLVEAIHQFEASRSVFDPEASRRQASKFAASRYSRELFDYLDAVVNPVTRLAA